MKILLLTLKTFSATGGIEKVCRVAGKAVNELSAEQPLDLQVYSMYDHTADARDNAYFPENKFKGFGKAKAKFIISAVLKGIKSDVIILSHINLLLAGWLIKKIAPKKKLLLIAHGIEIWNELSAQQKRMIAACDRIAAVSEFTRNVIIDKHKIAAEKCVLLNNCLDPLLEIPSGNKTGRKNIRSRYGFAENDFVLLTLTRLAATERYKRYDVVLSIVGELKNEHPDLRYMLTGKCTDDERIYLESLIGKYGLEKNVVLAGFVPDEEIGSYFEAADLYVMPSSKEGFGIVFIEAMLYGLPVIAGNKDGSVDALAKGALGTLVDPDDKSAIMSAILKVKQQPAEFIPDRNLLLEKFSFKTYKKNIGKLLSELNTAS